MKKRRGIVKTVDFGTKDAVYRLMPFVRHRGDAGPTGRIIETSGILSVGGSERVLDIPMRVNRPSEDRLAVTGETELKMTDFGVKPPTAMFGMLKTGDMVTVRWTWTLERDRPTGE